MPNGDNKDSKQPLANSSWGNLVIEELISITIYFNMSIFNNNYRTACRRRSHPLFRFSYSFQVYPRSIVSNTRYCICSISFALNLVCSQFSLLRCRYSGVFGNRYVSIDDRFYLDFGQTKSITFQLLNPSGQRSDRRPFP
jgi:hypothetical protein